MVTFKKCAFEKDMNDIIQLCGTWWHDSLFFKSYGVEYKVDTQMFLNVYDSGALIYLCGRDEEDELVSCYVGVKTPYMFNSSILAATEIVWCVRKEHRSFKNLYELVKEIEKLMVEENIQVWSLAVSNELKYGSTEKFLRRMGYSFMDRIYSRQRG